MLVLSCGGSFPRSDAFQLRARKTAFRVIYNQPFQGDASLVVYSNVIVHPHFICLFVIFFCLLCLGEPGGHLLGNRLSASAVLYAVLNVCVPILFSVMDMM